MSNPVISVIIVSYNTKHDLHQCLEGLKNESTPLEVFVVDNGSKDGTLEMLKSEYADWSALKVIENTENAGFTSASNQPITACLGEYILFLNSDTIIRSDSMRKLADYFNAHPDVGVVGPRLVYGDMKLQLSCFSASPILNLINIILWHVLPCNLAESFLIKCGYGYWSRQEQKDVGWVSGACLMIRSKLALELNGFDENFFLSAQDSLDLCTRVRQKNFRVVYYPKVEIVHYCGRSTKKDADAKDKVRFLLYMHMGHLYYYKKHHGYLPMVALKVLFSCLSFIKGLLAGALYLFSLSKRYKTVCKARFILAYKIILLPIPAADAH